MNIFLSPSNI